MNEKTTPIQCLELLAQATQPGVILKRGDYVTIQMALDTLAEFIKAHEKPTPS